MRNVVTWQEAFMDMAFLVSERSKDDSTQVGAVLVDSKNVIVSTGFNGPPPGINDALVPWNSRPEKYAYIIHAEENALWFGVERKSDLSNCVLFCTHYPCADCVLRLIRAKVSKIVIPSCHAPYPMSKYQVEPDALIAAQPFPKLEIVKMPYEKKVR